MDLHILNLVFYTDTLTNMFNCDSIVTLNLIIRNSSYFDVYVSLCDSYF